MSETSTKPYLIRAIYEWCADNGYRPYIAVAVDEHTVVPTEFVRNGEIVLNVSPDATRNLKIGNELIQFSARFNGVSREVSVPVTAVAGIFAKENGQGLAFQTPGSERSTPTLVSPAGGDSGGDKPTPPGRGRPRLQVVK